MGQGEKIFKKLFVVFFCVGGYGGDILICFLFVFLFFLGVMRKLSADFKGFSIGVYGLLAFGGSGVDGWVPGQVFDLYGFHMLINGE